MTCVILDTNVLVSALWRNMQQGKPALLLDLCLEKHYVAVYTQAIFDEYAAVLARPKFGFAQSDVSLLLGFFEFQALNADPLFESLSRPQCPDPDDQKFYDAASCCDALLVTGNKKHYPEDNRVITPAEFFELRQLPESKLLSFSVGHPST